MKRFTLLAAAGLFSMSLSAQEAKEEPKERRICIYYRKGTSYYFY